jgi:hypothetical protein
MTLALGACVLLASGGAAMLWQAVLRFLAWRRAQRRPRLRVVAGTSSPRWFRGGRAVRSATPLTRKRPRRRRRIEVSYLRCISGGSHPVSSMATVPLDIATGHESRRR